MKSSGSDLRFPALAGREVVARFDGGPLTSDAGLVWVALFVVLAVYALFAMALGTLDPILFQPLPAWSPAPGPGEGVALAAGGERVPWQPAERRAHRRQWTVCDDDQGPDHRSDSRLPGRQLLEWVVGLTAAPDPAPGTTTVACKRKSSFAEPASTI